jgi:hypothetical protein
LCAFTRILAERRAGPPVFLFDEFGGGARAGMGSVRQAGDRNIMGMVVMRFCCRARVQVEILRMVSVEAAREAALLRFNSVHVTVSTICRISFMCAQARIETE